LFTFIRLFSIFELALFSALLVVWIGGIDDHAKLVLGWAHGFGWIALCMCIAYACTRLVETPNGSTIAAIVFAVAAFTDGLDGYIARSRRSVTTFGKVMDPVADKLLIAAALISLVSLDRVAAWVAMVIIAREFAVSGLRIAAGQQGAVIPASPLGKLKTIVQVATVLALIAVDDPNAAWVQGMVYATVVVTVVSGVDYFLNVRKHIEEAQAERAARRGETASSQ
jgi:CDP-diacylglycerol--glycerol-3-phosphate 3-phosphatidyltransferase